MERPSEVYIFPYSTSGVGKSINHKVTIRVVDTPPEQLKVMKQIFGRVKRKEVK